MVDLKPFQGLRYNPLKTPLQQVVSPPYDVIGRELQQALYARSPYNAVRVDLNIVEPGDTQENNAFTRATHFLSSWQAEGILQTDAKPCIYAYSQSWQDGDTNYERKGVVALLKLEAYAAKKILPHEQTLKGPIADRLTLMKTTMANLSQIFMIYGDPSQTMERLLFDEVPPSDSNWQQATDEHGVLHRFYAVDDDTTINAIQALFADKSALIADGHHRYETALAFQKAVRDALGEKGEHPPEGSLPSDYLMVFLANLDDPGLLVLPTDRVLYKWPDDWDAERFEKALYEHYEKTTADKANFHVRLHGANNELTPVRLKNTAAMANVPDLLRDYDTAVLEETVFKNILGQESQQAMKLKHLLGFYRDPKYVKKLMDAGEAVAEFAMGPPPVALVKQICEAGYLMPQKSTYFYPKILTGLVFYPYTHLPPSLFSTSKLDPTVAMVPE